MCDFSGIYKFDYKDTMTIDIITIDKVSDSELAAIVFTSHDLDVAEVQLPLGGDGAYNITHLILPTIEWYKNELTKEHSKLYKYQDIYVTDEVVLNLFPKDEHLKKWIDLAHKKVQFQGLPARICWIKSGITEPREHITFP